MRHTALRPGSLASCGSQPKAFKHCFGFCRITDHCLQFDLGLQHWRSVNSGFQAQCALLFLVTPRSIFTFRKGLHLQLPLGLSAPSILISDVLIRKEVGASPPSSLPEDAAHCVGSSTLRRTMCVPVFPGEAPMCPPHCSAQKTLLGEGARIGATGIQCSI